MIRDESDQQNEEIPPNAALNRNFALSSSKRNESPDLTVPQISADDAVPVLAELVDPAPSAAHAVGKTESFNSDQIFKPGPGLATGGWVQATPQNLPPILQNISAVGGAVGSLVLGTWAILGSLLTPYSGINGLIGLGLGFWGLSSRKRLLAIIGIVLSLLAVGMSVLQVSEIISVYVLNPRQGP